MSAELNPGGAPEFLSSATSGQGILPALKEISRLVIRSLWRQHPDDTPDRRRMPTMPYSDESIAGQLISVTRESSAPIAKPQRTSAPAKTVEPLLAEPRAYSFQALWPDGTQEPVRDVERMLGHGDYAGAALSASRALAAMLSALPGPDGDVGPGAKAALLGLDGREYLRLCRLTTMPREAVTERDGLFALYVLVGAQIKLGAL
jgi:hypothetical protein